MKHVVRRLTTGLSLTELLLCLSIIAILTGVSWPTYRQQVLASRRAEAHAALRALMLQQEQHFMRHHQYTSFDADSSPTIFRWWSGETPTSSFYELRAGACADQALTHCVTLQALPGTDRVRAHHDPDCGTLTLDSHGRTSADHSPASGARCW